MSQTSHNPFDFIATPSMVVDLGERKLLVNAVEAETVRGMFQRYLELGSVPALAQDLDARGIRSKRWTSRSGIDHGGVRFNCGAVAHILKNRLYLGDAVHKGTAHSGEHEAIVPADLFASVEAKLARNRHRRSTRKTRAANCPLADRIFDGDG